MNLHKLALSAFCIMLLHSANAQEQSPGISVHFAFDKYDLNAADLTSLQNFKATHPDIESIIIDAYADSTGSDNYNYKLSQKRGNTVKQALGYDENKTEVIIKMTAHGEKDLLYATNDENRVALVSINQKKKEVVQQPLKKEEPVVTEAAPVEQPKQSLDTTPAIQSQPVAKAAPVASEPKEIGDDASALIKQLQNTKVGEGVVLKEIHFEEGRHVLLKSSRPSLTAMLNALKAMPSLQLEIQGHMCCGDALAADGFDMDTKEFKLSYNRAKEVDNYMVGNGIDASRLTFKGFGTRSRLVYPEVTDNDRAKNRRVEFVVTKK